MFDDALAWTRTRFAGASSLMIPGPGWGCLVFEHLLTSSATTAVRDRRDRCDVGTGPDREKRNHVRQLEALGYKVTLEPAA